MTKHDLADDLTEEVLQDPDLFSLGFVIEVMAKLLTQLRRENHELKIRVAQLEHTMTYNE